MQQIRAQDPFSPLYRYPHIEGVVEFESIGGCIKDLEAVVAKYFDSTGAKQ